MWKARFGPQALFWATLLYAVCHLFGRRCQLNITVRTNGLGLSRFICSPSSSLWFVATCLSISPEDTVSCRLSAVDRGTRHVDTLNDSPLERPSPGQSGQQRRPPSKWTSTDAVLGRLSWRPPGGQRRGKSLQWLKVYQPVNQYLH